MFMSKSVWLQQLDANARPAVRWTPARFLLVGGTVLIVLGLSGILGISESLSRSDLLNPPYWINWLHLSVGASGALVALKGNPNIHRGMAFVPAVLASTLGICGLGLEFVPLARQSIGAPGPLRAHRAHLRRYDGFLGGLEYQAADHVIVANSGIPCYTM